MELETNHSNQHDLLVFKHVCKLCSKSYPSGKSLGGHMRSHAIAEARKNKMVSSPSSLKKVPTFVENDSYLDANEDEDEDEEEDDDDDEDEITERNGNLGNSGYGLRENPRKTWRIVNNRSTIINNDNNNNNNNNSRDLSRDRDRDREGERVCKQCGKGFQSLKALCGHMSVHSNKYRYFKEEDDDISWSSDSKDQIFTAKEGNFDEDNKNNNNNNNKSSVCKTRSSSLSRYKSLIDFGSISNGYGSSSNNNSEIDQLEQEEVAMCLMMMSRDSCGSKSAGCFNFTAESSDNNSVILEGKVLDYDNVKNVRQEIENSDSGYFENGAKELESVDSVDLFVKNYGFGKEKVEFGSRLLVDSKKRKLIRDDYSYNISDNNANKYECPKCNKSFKTHQALGGHIISHRKDVENSFDNNNNSSKIHAKKASASKKVKGHKCPYCFKVFKSGQALGGHKRSHMMGTNNVLLHSGGGRFNRVPSSPPPPPEPEPEFKQPLIDLNLPAPVEEEASDNSQFVAW